MEFRKVIGFGKGSFVVSLPKDWVSRNRLKKGSTIGMDVNSSTILLSTDYQEKEPESKNITITADNKDIEQLRTEITTAYLNNFNVIEILSKKLNLVDGSIKAIIQNLAGLEILEQTNTKITAKFLMNMSEISIDSMIRRMDNITRSLIIDSLGCLKGENNAESITERDKDVNRLNFLLARAVREGISNERSRRKHDKNTWQLASALFISERLEKIADRQKRISRFLCQLKLSKKFGKEIKDVYDSISSSYLEVMKAFYQKDRDLAMKIELSNKQRIGSCDRLLSNQIKKEYKITGKSNSVYEHEHMIITDIAANLKAMATSVKLIARTVLNED